MISFVVIAVIALAASIKELTQAEKNGQSAAQFFSFDKYDALVGIVLYAVWSAVKYLVI
jgi:hypothetical protein